MPCKSKCIKYKVTRSGKGHYAIGHKRCQICEIFIIWEGLWCPCCGYRLRSKPRNSKIKEKYRKRIAEDK